MQEDKTGAAANPFRESFFVERKLCRCGAFSPPVLSNDLGVLTAPVGICNSAIETQIILSVYPIVQFRTKMRYVKSKNKNYSHQKISNKLELSKIIEKGMPNNIPCKECKYVEMNLSRNIFLDMYICIFYAYTVNCIHHCMKGAFLCRGSGHWMIFLQLNFNYICFLHILYVCYENLK